ncbi:MAG TPA: hypothetical protein PK586_03895 [Casimicrobium sp.]|nr:hypothetical protein [Casimicrobium sp.]
MKKFFVALALTCGVLALLSTSTAFAQPSGGASGAPAARIGVYDSRAVAIAYAGSSFQQQKMIALKAAHQRAKDAGDSAEMSRLSSDAKAEQAALHKQGFGTAPVDDLLAHIAAKLPKIQTDAGVARLISKWNSAELEKHTQAERVDVTMQLVDAFEPNDKQRKYAIEIQTRQPH